jgi:hypothetical protein
LDSNEFDRINSFVEPTTKFRSKKEKVQRLITEAIDALIILGIPFNGSTWRRIERIAMVFLATGQVNSAEGWKNIHDLNDGINMKTRDIIKYINEHFEENISSGSYDDIRRKELKLLVIGEVVLRTNENLARNDSTRGYAINPAITTELQNVGKAGWKDILQQATSRITTAAEKLNTTRSIQQMPVILPDGFEINLSPGEHNKLQKAIIEDLLPRYGYGAEVLYVGDTADKFLVLERAKLNALNFFELNHGELPDIVAYSKLKNWLYLIEAVHSFGPISENRLFELKRLTKDCTADIVYITAFWDRAKFRSWVKDIAWETEVWIAETPDHLIHFNGDRFMGPYIA